MVTIAESRPVRPSGCSCNRQVLTVEARARLYDTYRQVGWDDSDLSAFHADLPQTLLQEFWDFVDRFRTRAAARRRIA